MARVLVVEDEETLRRSVARGLSKLPGVEVVEAATLAEAVLAIDRAAPDVVLSDLDLPDRPGVELIGELGRRDLAPALTFVSAFARAFAAQIPRHSKVRVLEKPVAIERLREIVRADLDARGAPADAAPFGVPDYLQIACLGRHSVLITVEGAAASGRIVVAQGLLWHAVDREGTGEAAFQRLAVAPGTRVGCVALREAPGARTIERAWEALLLDAARLFDEETRDDADLFSDGPIETSASVVPPAPDAFDAAKDAGVAALLRRDRVAALAAFEEAERLRPGDRIVAANLARLRELSAKEVSS